MTGTLFNPALCAANHLLSPATISYFPFSYLFGLTAIGCITPFSLIDFDNSLNFSSSKIVLG